MIALMFLLNPYNYLKLVTINNDFVGKKKYFLLDISNLNRIEILVSIVVYNRNL